MRPDGATSLTVKHSALLPSEADAAYTESPRYSARKHQVPTAVGVNAAEGAVAASPTGVTVTGEPNAVPPLAQAVAAGPHQKKLTVPVGGPFVVSPVTVAVSVFESPRVIVPLASAPAVVELVRAWAGTRLNDRAPSAVSVLSETTATRRIARAPRRR